MKFDELIWQSNFGETFFRDSVGWPVDSIYVPVKFKTPILRVSCLSKTARSSWRAAGDIVQIIGDYRDPDFEGQLLPVPLNVIKLIEFSPTVDGYSLKFIPKPWLDSFELKIESPLTT